jgi:hypothetical protein
MRVVSQFIAGTSAMFTSIGPVMIHWIVSMSVCRSEIIKGTARFIMLIVTPMQRVPHTTVAVTSHLFVPLRPFTVPPHPPCNRR